MIDLAPLLAVLIIDVFGLDKIWGERRTYRLINHLSKGLFDRRKTPWIVKLPGLISKEQREKLASLVLPDEQNMTTTPPRASSALNAMYSPRSAIYYDGMDENIRKVVDAVGLSCMEAINKACPEQPKLYQTDSNFRACILRYEVLVSSSLHTYFLFLIYREARQTLHGTTIPRTRLACVFLH
jgi:hypothetical protein